MQLDSLKCYSHILAFFHALVGCLSLAVWHVINFVCIILAYKYTYTVNLFMLIFIFVQFHMTRTLTAHTSSYYTHGVGDQVEFLFIHWPVLYVQYIVVNSRMWCLLQNHLHLPNQTWNWYKPELCDVKYSFFCYDAPVVSFPLTILSSRICSLCYLGKQQQTDWIAFGISDSLDLAVMNPFKVAHLQTHPNR